MIYMNKVRAKAMLGIFMLSSCSGFDYFQAAPVIKNYFIGFDDLEISDEFFRQQEFSFIKIKIGKSRPAILSLAYINDGIYEWVSANDERIYTFNGKIVKTEGLNHNFQIIDPKGLSPISMLPINDSRFIELTNPKAITLQSYNTYINNVDESKIWLNEEVKTHGFSWSYVNSYLIDNESGLVIESAQRIHPSLAAFKLTFYYKF